MARKKLYHPIRNGQLELVGYVFMNNIVFPAHLGARTGELRRVQNLNSQIQEALGDKTVMIESEPVTKAEVETVWEICGEELPVFEEASA